MVALTIVFYETKTYEKNIMNLAFLKYANIHSSSGGPIKEILVRQLPSGEFEAQSHLDVHFKGEYFYKIYSSADGSGIDKNKRTAVYKSISEALERWAFRSKHKQISTNIEDLSSDGYACYPGFFSKSAKKHALAEATERWTICAWWEEKIQHETCFTEANLSTIVISSPCAQMYTVICAEKIPYNGDYFQIYGFAADADLKQSKQRALIELTRSKLNFEHFKKNESSLHINTIEKKFLYFGSIEGQQSFSKRVQKKIPIKKVKEPILIYDKEVVGPWTKYGFVWRCLFDMSEFSDRNKENYFFF
ncbi:MAG: hypothetical protein M9962_06045 [Oligoflexia bacterium]|nr:hypothetical protein [Oligoflexia bacterium]